MAAYEARRRGYDVEALPALGKHDKMMVMRDERGWGSIMKGRKPHEVAGGSPSEIMDAIRGEMSGYGDGARAIVRVRWKKEHGHVFIAEQMHGSTVFLDPQSGEKFVARYFNLAKTEGVHPLRTDDAEFSDLVTSAVRKAGKHV